MNSIVIYVLIAMSTGNHNFGTTTVIAQYETAKECQVYADHLDKQHFRMAQCIPSRVFYKSVKVGE